MREIERRVGEALGDLRRGASPNAMERPWGLSSRLPAIFAAVWGPWSRAILDENALA